MKEKVKSAAVVVKKQLQSCCPYGRFMDHPGEVEDMEQGIRDTDGRASVFDNGYLHCHAACLQKVVAVVANKSATRHPPNVLKIIQGKPTASRPKVVQSDACKHYTFSPWPIIKPVKTPELQISSPLQAPSTPTKVLELQIPVPSHLIRLESNTLVDTATTSSRDFSPKSHYTSSQIHAQSQSRGDSPTRAKHQHRSARCVYVPRGPLLHPSFEIVSNPALESPGGTLTSSCCSLDLKSKVSGCELPSRRPAVPAPTSSPSTSSGHGSKCRTLQSIAPATSDHSCDTKSQYPAADPARTGSKNMLHASSMTPKVPVTRVVQTSLTDQLDRQGSWGSREYKIFAKAVHSIKLGYQSPERSAVSSTSETGPVQSQCSHEMVTTAASGSVSNGLPTSDGQLHPEINVARVPAQSHSEEDLNAQADAKVQVACREDQLCGSNHKSKAPRTPDSSPCDEDPVRMLSQELKEVESISTQMSRIEAPPRVKKPLQQQRHPAAVAVAPASKGWNASIRTAQDCKVILRRRQEAAMKRERALQYALSRQRWKKSSKFQGPQWSTADVGILDKPGWIWSWLERAARMGAHGSQNRIFDNDSNPRDPQSESLSVKSTVGMCTTEIGSCGNNNKLQEQVPVGWSSPDQWPLSLRQQHAAGLLLAREDNAGKLSRLLKPKPATAAGPPVSLLALVADREHNIQEEKIHHHQWSTHKTLYKVEEPDALEKALSSRSKDEENEGESAESPESEYDTSRSGHGVARKLELGAGSLQQDQESIGSCAGDQVPMQTSMTCRLTSHFAAGSQRVRTLQYGTRLTSCANNNKRLSAVDSTDKVEIQQVQQHGQLDDQISCAILEDDDDSVATTAASIRRPFWRP